MQTKDYHHVYCGLYGGNFAQMQGFFDSFIHLFSHSLIRRDVETISLRSIDRGGRHSMNLTWVNHILVSANKPQGSQAVDTDLHCRGGTPRLAYSPVGSGGGGGGRVAPRKTGWRCVARFP